MDPKQSGEEISEQEAARRRDELWHMISRPPTPHHPLEASKRKTRPANKGRVRKGKSHR
jgi:hypothetical protein